MDGSGVSSPKYLRLTVLTISAACAACGDSSHKEQTNDGAVAAVPGPLIAPLSADDVSVLFPAPTRAEDFAKLIAVADLTTQNSLLDGH